MQRLAAAFPGFRDELTDDDDESYPPTDLDSDGDCPCAASRARRARVQAPAPARARTPLASEGEWLRSGRLHSRDDWREWRVAADCGRPVSATGDWRGLRGRQGLLNGDWGL
jgi:hypothetical protein